MSFNGVVGGLRDEDRVEIKVMFLLSFLWKITIGLFLGEIAINSNVQKQKLSTVLVMVVK